MAASIAVDIKAQITGYQEQIAKLQDALNKIKIDGGIGKDLANEINNIQKLINDLNKKSNIRITSDSGIDHLTDKMTTISERIQEVGTRMQGLTLDNLDFSKLSQGTQQAIKDLQTLQSKLESDMTRGLQQKLQSAVEHGSALGRTLEKLQVDIKTLDTESGKEILSTAFENANTKAHETANEIKKLRAEIKQYKADISNLENSSLLDKSFDLSGQLDKLRNAKGVTSGKQKDYLSTENGSASAAVIEQWQANLSKLEIKTDEAKQKIQDFFKALSETSDLNQAKILVQDFLNSYASLGVKAKELQGAIKISDLINTATVDPNKVTEVKDTITTLLKQAGNSIKPEDGARIEALINAGSLEDARKETISLLTKTYANIISELQKKQGELGTALQQLGIKREQLGALFNERNDASRAGTAYDDIVRKLTQENAELKSRAETAEKLVNEKLADELGKIKGTGADVGRQSQQSLIEAKEAAGLYRTELEQVQAKEQLIGKIEGVVQRWFSVYAAVRMVSQAVRSVISTVQELDKTITQIAIVTNMTQQDLWGQMKSYTDMARQYATSISGVYEVSQLYYQQGLQTADVMALTEETLKMARISGLDYATATDYMTNAVRSFKMEMQDAQAVVDVYSEIAASSATSTTELATAMSKTASSAEAVGSSFENTTAMMAVMIESTRESAENIGSAMKSIISRYGEMTADPSKLTDSEGEALSLNKVDKALQTVGITIHDTAGQFRDFDDVIMELAGKWDTIDKNTQRYIATVMAGNRQQSRFLALVSNGERLTELSEKAANSQDTATLQVLKTMDSIEAKTQQLKTTLQSLYVDSGIENMYKGILDFGNSILNTFAQMTRWAGLPIPAIIHLGTTFASLSNVITTTFGLIKAKTQAQISALNIKERAAMQERVSIAQQELAKKDVIILQEEIAREKATQHENQDELMKSQQRIRIWEEELARKQGIANTPIGTPGLSRGFSKASALGSVGLNLAGVVLSGIASGISDDNRIAKGLTGVAASAASMAGLGNMIAPGVGAGIGAIAGAVMGLVENLNILHSSAEDEAKRLKEAADEAKNNYLQRKSETSDLSEQIEKLKELEKAQYNNAEARQEFIELSNQMAESNSSLVSGYDSEGNAIISLSSSYYELAKAREAALEAAKKSAASSVEEAKNAEQESQNTYEEALNEYENKLYSGYREADTTDALSYLKSKGANIVDEEALKGYISRINPSTNPTVLQQTISDLINNWSDIVDEEVLNYFDQLIEGAEDLSNSRTIATELFDDKQQDLILAIEESLTSHDTEKSVNLIQNHREDLENIRKDLINNGSQWAADYITNWLETAGEITNLFSDTLKAQENTSNTVKRELSSYVQTALLGQDGEIGNAYLKEMESVNSIITQMLQEKFQGSGLEIEPYLEKQVSTDLEDIQNQLKEFWNKTLDTNTKRDNFNNLIKNAQQYNPTQLREILIKEFNTTFEQAQNILKSIYGEQYLAPILDFYKSIEKRVSDNTQQLYSELQSFKVDDLGQADTIAILDAYDKLANMVEAGNMSDANAAGLFEQYRGLWNISKEIGDLGDQQQVQGLLQNFDFSLESITNLLNGLDGLTIGAESEQQLEALKTSAEKLKSIIPVNLNTEIETFTSKLGQGMEDFEKALSSASKGMDFKTASEIAGKMGKSVSDFILRNGQFFVNSIEDLKKAYLGDTDSFLANLKEQVNKQTEQLSKISVINRSDGYGNLWQNSLNFSTASKEDVQKYIDENKEALQSAYPDINFDTIVPQWEEWQKSAADSGIGFITWLINNLNHSIDEAEKAANEYASRKASEAALQLGLYTEFIDANTAENNKEAARIAFENADIETLLNIYPQFSSIIVNNFDGIARGLLDKISSESKTDNFIEVTAENKGLINKLKDAGLIITEKEDEIIEGETVRLEGLTNETLNAYLEFIDNNIQDPTEKAQARAKATTTLYDQSIDKAAQEVFKNTDNVSVIAYEELMQRLQELGLNAEAAAKLFKQNGDHYELTNINSLLSLLLGNISKATQQAGEEAIQKTADDILKQISDASSLVTKGTTSPEAMQKFVTNFNEATGKSLKMQDLFSFSDVADGFTLNTGVFREYADILKSKVAEGQMSAEWAEKLIEQATNEIRNSIDIKGYLDSDKGTLSTKKLREQIENYYDAVTESAEILAQQNNITRRKGETGSEYLERIKNYRKTIINETTTNLLNAINEGGQAAVNAMRSVSDDGVLSAEEVEAAYRGQVAELENAFDQLAYKSGAIVSGIAKEILEDIDGFKIKDLGDGSGVIESTGEVVEAYREFYIRLYNTHEATVAELNEAGAKILETRNGTDEALAIDALGDAAHMSYQRLGEILAEKGIELSENYYNEVISKYIEKLGPNQIAITDFSGFVKDILGITDFSSPEYISAFKTYNDSLIAMNRKVERNITEEIQSIGKAKVGDAINLTQFTHELNNEVEVKLIERLKDFKATLSNGILVFDEGANIPAIMQIIANEAAENGLLLQDNMAELADTLNQVLENYTTLINNGIEGKLTNVEAQQLQTQAASYGFKGSLNFKETANGLKLSEQSAAALYTHLKNIDIVKSRLVFDKLYDSITASDGKLNTMSKTMTAIASLQKKIANNERKIVSLRNANIPDRAEQISKENEELKTQLELYQDIRLEQMGDAESYSFMDKDLPEIFKGPQNYWNSVNKAFSAINQAGEKGYMEIADFYNFINEASNLVKMSGQSINLWGMEIDGSATNCAALIERGFGALSNIDGEGVKIDLKRLGVNFKSGADGMSGDFSAGIKTFAKSQIALIDATIAMLETFVAMDALGEIDVNKNGIFDFTAQELGTLDEQGEYIETFGTGYKNAIEKIKTYFENNKDNKDIQNAYNNFKINGHSIKELLNASEEQLKEWGIKGKTLQTLLQKFYELSQSDEFATDPSEIWKQIAESLSDEELADLNFTFNSPKIGQMTIENGNKFGIDFKSAAAVSAKEFLKKHGANAKTLDDSLTEAFKKYEAGTATEVEFTAVLMAKGIVETRDDGLYVNNEGPFENEKDPKYIEAITKAALKDKGAFDIKPVDYGEHTFEGKIRYGNKEIRVSSDGNGFNYYSDMPGMDSNHSYNNIDELLKDEYEQAGGMKGTKLTFETWKSSEYNLHLDLKTTIKSNLNEPELRQKAQEVINMPLETVKEIIEPQTQEGQQRINSDGSIIVDVNGIEIEVENNTTLEQKAAAIQEKLINTVDPDGLITKISLGITNAFKNLNIAQLLIDGLRTSLDVQVGDSGITFTNDPVITALGANLGQGMAAGIAAASGNGITSFFTDNKNKTTITKPIQTGLANTANDSTITDRDYEISHATATLKKMEINQVDEAGFSSSILSNIMKAAKVLGGGNGSDLTLDSATAAIKKLNIVSVDDTSLNTQVQAEINAKVGDIDVSSITTARQEIIDTITAVAKNLYILKSRIGDLSTNSDNAKTNVNNLQTVLRNISNSKGPERAERFKQSLNTINQIGPNRAETFRNALNGISQNGPNRAFNFKEAANGLSNYSSQYASNFVRAVNSLQDKSGIAWNFVWAMNSMQHGGFSVDIYINDWRTYWNTRSWAKGNAALAKGTAVDADSYQAFAGGSKKTLVGELGPELVVSNGRYFIVGQNGAEMIDLPKDAIVFNHLQTKKLLGSGKGDRGTPVTNEKNAVSYATGNVSGPALVSASQAIAALKQLRAMWESLLTASAKELGSQAGKSAPKSTTKTTTGRSGSGSGSGSTSKPSTTKADDGTRIKTTTAEIQRWYNLLRQIAKTEKDITYEEKLQSQYQSLRIADGNSLYKSYKQELSMLEDQIDRSKELAALQKEWYNDKRAELAASAYGKIFQYTEDGLQQYVSGRNKGLDILEKLTETDIWGNPTGHAETAAKQLSYIKSLGFDLNELLSSSDGTKVAGSISSVNVIYDENGKRLKGQDLINAQVGIMENFWDNIDGWRDELDSLYDSYREQLDNVIDNQNQQNEVMQKIVDNQIEVENKVYEALVDMRQTAIDNSKKELDAYQKNTTDMIDGLNNTLDKERNLYNNQKNADDLLKLQRQLTILQRSGGSTSQILNLQQQIATKQQDMYFDEKEEQIKALQEASDLQAKKMQEQIELMTETLEYQKSNGLLWKDVSTIMNQNQQSILAFISNNLIDLIDKSSLQTSQSIADLQTKIQVYVSSRDDNFMKYYNDISSDVRNIAGTIAQRSSTNLKTYKNGGLIDFTGPAWVDGTSTKPEAILDADETKFVQNKLPDILNNTDTLQERQIDLETIRTNWLSSISYVIDTNNQNDGITIENIEFNMQVEQLSNSTDAKKLGQEAFNELLNIARKAGKNRVARR